MHATVEIPLPPFVPLAEREAPKVRYLGKLAGLDRDVVVAAIERVNDQVSSVDVVLPRVERTLHRVYAHANTDVWERRVVIWTDEIEPPCSGVWRSAVSDDNDLRTAHSRELLSFLPQAEALFDAGPDARLLAECAARGWLAFTEADLRAVIDDDHDDLARAWVFALPRLLRRLDLKILAERTAFARARLFLSYLPERAS